MQNEIVSPANLLDENGRLVQKGWARKSLLTYNREKIRAGWYRVKEWDIYTVIGPRYGITLSISDLGYIAVCSIAWLDFTEHCVTQEFDSQLFTMGRLNLPRNSADGESIFNGKYIKMRFLKKGNSRILSVDCPSFGYRKGLRGELVLTEDPTMDSIVVATPFKKPAAFYYRQHINSMPATGEIVFQNQAFEFSKTDCFASLSWGRGVWTYKNTLYGGSASGIIGGTPFGFHIGSGKGDPSVTENMLFHNDRGHKLDQVTFEIPVDDNGKEDYMKPWTFSSNDGRFEMKLEPILEVANDLNMLFIKSINNQVFGYFTGDVLLDDGQKIHVDRLLGFAEKRINIW
jgi:hypothetical protein